MTANPPEKPASQRGVMARIRGFSLVELLVSAAIATTGMYASLSMCMSALQGNTEMRDSAIALTQAEHVLATMQGEAWLWQDKMDTLPRFFRHMPTPFAVGQSTGWKTLRSNPFAPDKRVGDMGDDAHIYDQGLLYALPSADRPRYCTQWRMTWVTADLIRAEVRVGWSRPHVPADKYKACPNAMFDDIGNVLSVAIPAMVMRNVYAQ